MNLQEFCKSLSVKEQIIRGIHLGKLALSNWEKYAPEGISYTDSVVGMSHHIEADLLKRALLELEDVNHTTAFQEKGEFTPLLKSIYEEFTDPVVSLQDRDLEFPLPVEKTFYSVYNLVSSVVLGELNNNERMYVAYNQAFEAIVTGEILSFDEAADSIGWFG